MKKYKCPDCGKEFSEGSTMPVECPICGCPFEKFEMIEIIEETQNVKYCSHCGKPLPLHNVKFCPECGCNLTAQPTKDYDVICPDCNSVITDENSDCPNCGCPPSEFKRHIKEKEHHKPKTQKKSGASQALIIICILALIGGVGLYYKNKNEAEAEEKAQQEQYQKEQQEQQAQREREEREAADAKRRQEEIEHKIREKQRELNRKLTSSAWSSGTFSTGTGIYELRFFFNESGQLKICMYDYVGSSFGKLIDSEYGSWDLISPEESDGSFCLIISWNGNTERQIFTGSSFTFGGRHYSQSMF